MTWHSILKRKRTELVASPPGALCPTVRRRTVRTAPSPLRLPRRFAAAAVAVAIALPGCANYFGIHSDRRMAPPANFEAARSLPSEGGRGPPRDWASQFGDPQLPKLIAEALGGNPSIAQALAR